jgi:hypothetical protein
MTAAERFIVFVSTVALFALLWIVLGLVARVASELFLLGWRVL